MEQHRARYQQRCRQAADAARAAGVSLRKLPARHALELSVAGGAVSFPIATDERSWRETSEEEALFAVLTDTYDWTLVDGRNLDGSGSVGHAEVAAIRRNLEHQEARVLALVGLMQGVDNLRALYATVGLTVDRAALFRA